MKNAIVVEYASMWPREVLDMREENEGRLYLRNAEFLRRPGVYILYRNEHPYYIGKATKRLASRLWDHANNPADKYYNFWNLFSAFVVRDKKYLGELEGILIAAMPPTANSSTPRMTRIRLPKGISRQLREIRKHRANPLTRREFAKATKLT